MLDTTDIALLKHKIFQYHFNFENFKSVNEEKVNHKLDLFTNMNENTRVKSINPKSIIFNNAFKYINEKNDMIYDEKILFLIKAIDPDCEMYKLYIQLGNISKSEIEEAEGKEKEKLQNERKITKEKNAKIIREQLGIYDANLIYYESIYLKKLNKKSKLITGVKIDYINPLFKNFYESENNLDMDISDISKLLVYANNYIKTNGIPDINDLAFQLTTQAHILNITDIKKKILFIIFVIDKDLQAFKIYDDESKWQNIKKECIEQMGFFNKGLIDAEILYNKTFNKEKKLSQW